MRHPHSDPPKSLGEWSLLCPRQHPVPRTYPQRGARSKADTWSWTFSGKQAPLSYSGGNAAAPAAAPGVAHTDRDHNGFLSDLQCDAHSDDIVKMDEGGSKDEARLTKAQDARRLQLLPLRLFTLAYLKLAQDQSKQPPPGALASTGCRCTAW